MNYRPIRYVDPAAIAIDIALALPDTEDAERFIALDLATALRMLAIPGQVEELERGQSWVGGRLVVEPGTTVGAFNLFVDLADDGAVLVIGVDIWPHGFPIEPEGF